MERVKGAICVTGATGYIASWLIMRLLDCGYSVNATIRPDPEHKRDISFLTNLPGASDKLKIFHADLSDPNSFDAAIDGCVGVFHLATPLFRHFDGEESQVVIDKAIEGTIGILKVCLKHANTVKRIVYTSSIAAVAFNDSNAEVMDESFWSNVDYIKDLKHFSGHNYYISKTLTEKSALEFAEQHGLNLVTVIPPYVIGPFICPHLPDSVNGALAMILGKPNLYGCILNTPMVHVDDYARASIFLLENSNAKGKYICSSDSITIEEMSKFLSAKYPEYSIPTIESLKDIKGFRFPALSSKKLIDSGFEFKYGISDIFDGAIQSCKENGYI